MYPSTVVNAALSFLVNGLSPSWTAFRIAALPSLCSGSRIPDFLSAIEPQGAEDDLIYWGVSYTRRVPIKAAPAGVRHGLKGRKHAEINDSHVFTA